MEQDMSQATQRRRDARHILQLPADRKALLQHGTNFVCLSLLALIPENQGQVEQSRGDASLLACFASQRETLSIQGTSARVIALGERDAAEVMKRRSDTELVVRLPPDSEALGEERARRRVVSLPIRDVSKVVERGGDGPAIRLILTQSEAFLVQNPRFG